MTRDDRRFPRSSPFSVRAKYVGRGGGILNIPVTARTLVYTPMNCELSFDFEYAQIPRVTRSVIRRIVHLRNRTFAMCEKPPVSTF